MALITKASQDVFNLEQIQRGDCIHIRRTGDTTFRNGFVTEVSTDRLRLLYCNTQNNATSYLDVMAADVVIGVWEIYWTSDFQTINYEYNATVTKT